MTAPTPACPPTPVPSSRRIRRWLAAGCLLGVSACNLGPDYQRPELPAPAAWSGADGQAAAWPSTDWWRSFGSPQLDTYIAQAQHTNDDLAAAIARVREADA